MVDRDLGCPYHWAVCESQLVGFNGCRRVELVKKEAAGKIKEVVLTDLQTEPMK